MPKRDKPTIDKRAVEALTPGAQITDSVIRGFRARCLPSGTVRFDYRYQTPFGQKEIKLGLYGEITAAQARDLAADNAYRRRQGGDPAAEQKHAAAKAVMTVNILLDRWLAEKIEGKKRTADAIARMLDYYVRPAIGERSIYDDELFGHIRDMLAAIVKGIKARNTGKGRGLRGGVTTANQVRAYLGGALKWWKFSQDPKFAGALMPEKAEGGSKPRERKLSPLEIRYLWAALDALDADDATAARGAPSPVRLPENKPFTAWTRMLILTGTRRSEAAGMHAHELARLDDPWGVVEDATVETADTWVIPAERAKNGTPHTVPLSPTLKALLPQHGGYLFSTTGGEKPLGGISKFYDRLNRKINELRARDDRGPIEHWTWHDLRRTMSTLMNEQLDVDYRVVEMLLGHKIKGVEEVYNRAEYRAKRAKALAQWLDYVAHVVRREPPSPTSTTTTNNVVALSSARPPRAALRGVRR